MNKKKIVALLIFSCSICFTNAQRFFHGAGAGFNFMSHKLAFTNSYDGSAVKHVLRGSIDYSPRYNMVQFSNGAISVNAPVSIGLGAFRSDQETGFLLAGDASGGLYYNYGLKSTRQNESKFGFYLGTGFSYGFTNIYLGYGNLKLKTYGPMGNIGVRFLLDDSEVVNVGFFYRHGMEDDKFKTYGLKFGVDF